ncbi:MAG: hypothetical protein ABJP48_02495 [Erythrobacter sp.]
MKLNRRSAIMGSLSAAIATSIPAMGCAQASNNSGSKANRVSRSGVTQLTVLGVIHSNHRNSRAYSLDVLQQAVRRAQPDVILTEIPPDRIAEAKRGFAETGEVTESRTRVFPEYTDVVFPLSREMDFEIVATAGWTIDIHNNRRDALQRIENDPARVSQWAEHLAARRQYSRDLRGRGDDPLFIHTSEYDAFVERAQTPYQTHFDADLGAGGWTQINRAHTDLINAELDKITGQGLNALITFGSWHKYMILRSLAGRDDIELRDPQRLFS